ncbi:MAG TPA: hypothetical protein VGU90_17410 [Terriglobales bacterium]|nr:hypothetical protein [Terriglobales bacterium]
MRQLLKNQVLDALRDSLRDLENLKLVSADEPEVALLKQQLQSKISEIENDGTGDEQYREMAA